MDKISAHNKIEILKVKDKYPVLVQDAISMIENNFAFLYGIDDLAEQLEVTEPHLIRTFTAHTGLSPGKYLIIIRLENTRRILRSHKFANLEMVATACGFSCANYFSKVFKKYMKQTPLEYARNAADESADYEHLDYDDAFLQRMYL